MRAVETASSIRSAAILAASCFASLRFKLRPTITGGKRFNDSYSDIAPTEPDVLNLVLGESALELVPTEIAGHASIRNDAKRRGSGTTSILLDRSIHHSAMLKLKEDFKRGRPDLVHLAVLCATSTPIFLEGMGKMYVHTRDDLVLDFETKTRPPKSYDRFRDLVQKLLIEQPQSGLVRVYQSRLSSLLRGIGADLTVGLSVQGRQSSFEELAEEVVEYRRPVLVVGGFPKGHFSPDATRAFDRVLRIDSRSLDAHVVVARAVYEIEKRAGAGNPWGNGRERRNQ